MLVVLRSVVRQLTSLQKRHSGKLMACHDVSKSQAAFTQRLAGTSSGDKAIIIAMPKLSPSMTEGSVSKWLKVWETGCMHGYGAVLHADVLLDDIF